MDNLAAFAFYLFYIICMLAQIYLQCYFGSLAASESENTLQAVFASNWLDVDLRNRKFLIMFMIRLREQCRIKTMKIFQIDHRVFMSVRREEGEGLKQQKRLIKLNVN